MLRYKINKNGITILEVIVSIAIILLIILILINIFTLALKITRAAEQTTVATNLAQAKIEELFYFNYDYLPIGTIEPRHRLASNPENPFYHYERETTVSYVDQNLNPAASETGLKKIETKVYWKNPIFFWERDVNLIILISQK